MNLKTLKKERDKLVAQIEKCRQDLAAVDRVIRLFAEKGEGAGDPAVQEAVVPEALVVAPVPVGRARVQGMNTAVAAIDDDDGAGKGWLKELVMKALEGMSGEFDKTAVFEKVVAMNPENKERIRPEAVSAVVWRMANRSRELETITTGAGRTASLYRKRI